MKTLWEVSVSQGRARISEWQPGRIGLSWDIHPTGRGSFRHAPEGASLEQMKQTILADIKQAWCTIPEMEKSFKQAQDALAQKVAASITGQMELF